MVGKPIGISFQRQDFMHFSMSYKGDMPFRFWMLEYGKSNPDFSKGKVVFSP